MKNKQFIQPKKFKQILLFSFLVCSVFASCKKDVNNEVSQASVNKQDADTRALYNSELSKEFSNVVLKPITDKDADTTNILRFKTMEEFKEYLRKDPLVIKKGQPVKSQLVLTSSELEANNRKNPPVIKRLNIVSSGEDGGGNYISGWSQAVPVQDFEGFTIGLSAIVNYSASFQSNRWYKQISSVGSLAASGGRDVTISNPVIGGGSERIRIKTTGISSNILYKGYSAQVVANVEIVQTKTAEIMGRKSTVEQTFTRPVTGNIASDSLPDPSGVE